MHGLDERQLGELLETRVLGARVVYVEGQGFWALIPHYRDEPGYARQFTLASHYLGIDYQEAQQMLKRCWNVYE